MLRFRGAYIKGRFTRPERPRVQHVKRDPGDISRIVGEWSDTTSEVATAVEAAASAFDEWAWQSQDYRFSCLKRLQAALEQHHDELADRIASEMGKILPEAHAEVEAAIRKIDITINEGMKLVETKQVNSGTQYYRYHPRGVLAILGPFNFPVHLPNSHWVPALATGNTIVFKPSELTPFTGQLLARCFKEADFPPGVFNMVQGGKKVGTALVKHPKVAGVLFVGSDETGHAIQRETREDTGKICVLEMGGKNAAIILPDGSVDLALRDCARSAFATTGQRCNSLSRVIIHQDLVTNFTIELACEALSWHAGYYKDERVMMGPLVSKPAMRRFLQYQDKAVKEGGHAVLKGRRIQPGRKGHYVLPGIHRMETAEPATERRGYRYDEIFGPDIAIYTFKTLEEAIRIHNDSRYGLVASVYTKKKKDFETMFRYLQVGNLHWNRPTIGASPHLPFGGLKASGNDRPAGIMSALYCAYPVAVRT